MEKHQMFRIATLLYAETEGIKKKTTVLKRVIEAALVEKENSAMSVEELEKCIKSSFDITILKSEIDSIVSDENNKHFERVVDKREVKICLTANRYRKLAANLQKSVAEYIDEYVIINGLDSSAKETILGYFYDVCQRNISDFKAIILGKNIPADDLTESINSKQADSINGFLQWENPDKNNSLLALLGYSLEYSMLTCDSNVLFGTRLGTMFSNKKLYIDTNIIYYCLGINGEEYKRVNDSLLDKCIACNEKLYITRYTEAEFNNTLDHYIDEITKYDSASITNLKFHKYLHNQDIYLFYLEWKTTRKKFNTPNYFKSFLQVEYANWKKKYNIYVENDAPYNEADEKNVTSISEYCEAFTYNGKINYDAYNIFWVEKKREQNSGYCRDFSTTEYFILSPHKLIKRWDSSRKNSVPVIVTPTMWLTLLNRFISRSEDDYECFKNFVCIKVMEDEPINNREFLSIVKAIEEVTEDLSQQETIIDEFVAQNFAYLGKTEEDSNISLDLVQDKTREATQKIMDSRVSKLEEQVSTLNNELTKQAIDKRNQIEKSNEVISQKNEILAENEKIVKEKTAQLNSEKEKNKKLIKKQIRRELRNKRIMNGMLIAIFSGLLIWQFVDFFVLKNPSNIVCNLLVALLKDTVLENSIPDTFIAMISFFVSCIVFKLYYQLSKIFWNKKYIEQYQDGRVQKLKEELE